jgi:predicted secreted protein
MPGFWAHGTTIEFGGVKIGKPTSIGLPEQSKEEVEVTSHDSMGWREFVAGLRDGGTCAITCRIDPEDQGQDELWSNFNADGDTAEVTVITLPEYQGNHLTLTFNSWVLDTGGEAPFDDAGEITFTLRLTGLVTRALVPAES